MEKDSGALMAGRARGAGGNPQAFATHAQRGLTALKPTVIGALENIGGAFPTLNLVADHA